MTDTTQPPFVLDASPVPPGDARHAALKKAFQWLNAANVRYAVECFDGKIVGQLVAAPPDGKKLSRVKVYDWKKIVPGYINEITQMKNKPGSVATWTLENEQMADAFQRAVSGNASRLLGRGGTFTTGRPVARNGDPRVKVQLIYAGPLE